MKEKKIVLSLQRKYFIQLMYRGMEREIALEE